MCFSAAASFASAGVLAIAGAVTLRQARLPAQRPFAAIPCLFAVQQGVEGLTWLGIPAAGSAFAHAPVYLFLIVAQLVWPVWIPMALQQIAPPERRRSIGVVLALGCGVALVLAWCMIRHGAEAGIVAHHIAYALPYPPLVKETCGLLYGVAVIAPPFMTGLRSMPWLGVGIAVAYLATAIVYQYCVISVWCYIAALMSMLVIAVQRANRALPAPPRAPAPILGAAAPARDGTAW